MELLSGCYWELDASGRVCHLVAAAPWDSEFQSDCLKGRFIWDAVGTASAVNRDRLKAHVLDREPFADVRIAWTGPDGSRRMLGASGKPRFDAADNFLGYMIMTRDVTREALERELYDLDNALARLFLGTPNGECVDAALGLVCRRLNWHFADYWQSDEADGVMRLELSVRSEALEASDPDRTAVVVRKGEGLIGQAWASAECVWKKFDNESGVDAGYAIAVPAIRRQDILGVLEFRTRRIEHPSGKLLNVLSRLAAGICNAHERAAAMDKLRKREEQYSSTVELAAVGICHIRLDGKIIDVNRRMSEILGYSKKELLSKTIKEISHPADRDVTDEFSRQLASRAINSFKTEKRYLRKDGSVVWARISTVMKWDSQGDPLHHISVVEDISDKKAAEARIEHLATHDELTGLHNKTLFNELLIHSIRSRGRAGRKKKCAVLFIDLDRFKLMNGSLGHQAGDYLLKSVADRIKSCVRECDCVARFGGDEFVVLLNDMEASVDAETVARKVIASLREPIHLQGHECRITASIGIAVCPDDGVSVETLMRNADTAMCSAKQGGRDSYCRYSMDMASASVNQVTLETQLRHALERNEFTVHYQPKIDSRTGAIAGMEALLRWRNATLGVIPPIQFIPVAEDNGMIVPIGKWVLETSCAQNACWRNAGFDPGAVSVNLSPRQFSDPGLLPAIMQALEHSGVAPELLELEITESMLMLDLERAVETARSIRALGVKLSIDDFGTGYSSLAQLKRFPVDTIKIDRSFVRDLPTDQEDRAIVQAIIAMGKALGVTVVAEGVERLEQSVLLTKLGCDQMQGFFFSEPRDAEDLVGILQDQILQTNAPNFSSANGFQGLE